MSERPCRTCRDWAGCQGFDFYLPADIQAQYCRCQVLWIVSRLDGCTSWPLDPRPTGYIDQGFNGRVKAEAAFEIVGQFTGEINWRLDRCGKDGQTLEHEVRVLNAYSYEMLSQPARDALNYCAGRKRKRLSYYDWLNQRERRIRFVL